MISIDCTALCHLITSGYSLVDAMNSLPVIGFSFGIALGLVGLGVDLCYLYLHGSGWLANVEPSKRKLTKVKLFVDCSGQPGGLDDASVCPRRYVTLRSA